MTESAAPVLYGKYQLLELLARGGLYAGFWGRQSGGSIGIQAAE